MIKFCKMVIHILTLILTLIPYSFYSKLCIACHKQPPLASSQSLVMNSRLSHPLASQSIVMGSRRLPWIAASRILTIPSLSLVVGSRLLHPNHIIITIRCQNPSGVEGVVCSLSQILLFSIDFLLFVVSVLFGRRVMVLESVWSCRESVYKLTFKYDGYFKEIKDITRIKYHLRKQKTIMVDTDLYNKMIMEEDLSKFYKWA